jgi:hypothetical protein
MPPSYGARRRPLSSEHKRGVCWKREIEIILDSRTQSQIMGIKDTVKNRNYVLSLYCAQNTLEMS